jgi:hypothetical protein
MSSESKDTVENFLIAFLNSYKKGSNLKSCENKEDLNLKDGGIMDEKTLQTKIDSFCCYIFLGKIPKNVSSERKKITFLAKHIIMRRDSIDEITLIGADLSTKQIVALPLKSVAIYSYVLENWYQNGESNDYSSYTDQILFVVDQILPAVDHMLPADDQMLPADDMINVYEKKSCDPILHFFTVLIMNSIPMLWSCENNIGFWNPVDVCMESHRKILNEKMIVGKGKNNGIFNCSDYIKFVE